VRSRHQLTAGCEECIAESEELLLAQQQSADTDVDGQEKQRHQPHEPAQRLLILQPSEVLGPRRVRLGDEAIAACSGERVQKRQVRSAHSKLRRVRHVETRLSGFDVSCAARLNRNFIRALS
jgi:hypothetical protein